MVMVVVGVRVSDFGLAGAFVEEDWIGALISDED